MKKKYKYIFFVSAKSTVNTDYNIDQFHFFIKKLPRYISISNKDEQELKIYPFGNNSYFFISELTEVQRTKLKYKVKDYTWHFKVEVGLVDKLLPDVLSLVVQKRLTGV